MQIRQRIPGKENIPEGFAFKKKCAHQLGCSSPPFGVYVFSFQEYHLRFVFLVSFPLFGPKELEQEQRLRPSDRTQVQPGMPLVCNGVCSFQCYPAPRAASEAISQLSCWHETAFPSPHCQMPPAAHFSSLSLRKQRLAALLPSAQAQQQLRVRSSAAECVRGSSQSAGRRQCFGECSTDAAIAGLLCPALRGSLCCRRRRCTEQLSGLRHSPCSRRRHRGRCQVWPSPPHWQLTVQGVTSSLGEKPGGGSFLSLIFPVSLSDDLRRHAEGPFRWPRLQPL